MMVNLSDADLQTLAKRADRLWHRITHHMRDDRHRPEREMKARRARVERVTDLVYEELHRREEALRTAEADRMAAGGIRQVVVRRHPGDYRAATYAEDRVFDPHIRSASGGVNRRTPRPMLFVRVWCDGMLEGEAAHSCRHAPGPHEILVVVQKNDNDPAVYTALRDRVRT